MGPRYDDDTPMFTRMMQARQEAMHARNAEIALLNQWWGLPTFEKED